MIIPDHSALLTDFYELTMMQGFFKKDPHRRAVFDLFFRKQPFKGGFTVFAGLDCILDTLSELKFSAEDIDYLDSLHSFDNDFLDYLRQFRFNGDVFSMTEGSVVFPGEPLMRIHTTLLEAQLVEPLLLNTINFQSLIATKSRRIVSACRNKTVMEFGLRRAQGINGAIAASRAAFIGGTAATSNTLAGRLFNIPVRGTMAHSWIMSYPSELEAFRAFARLYPDTAILLVDTYSTLKSGIPNAMRIFKELKISGHSGYGIRLDSGDLDFLSKSARKLLDDQGFPEAQIVASNELDEYVIRQLVEDQAPIDSWGVGTRLVTGGEDSALTGVYKLAAKEDGDQWMASMKITNNPDKMTLPGVKNIRRFVDIDGKILADLIYLEDQANELNRIIEAGEPITFYHPTIDFAEMTLEQYDHSDILLHPVLKKGQRLFPPKSLTEIQNDAAHSFRSLDPSFFRLLNPHIYKVSITGKLRELKESMIRYHQSGIL